MSQEDDGFEENITFLDNNINQKLDETDLMTGTFEKESYSYNNINREEERWNYELEPDESRLIREKKNDPLDCLKEIFLHRKLSNNETSGLNLQKIVEICEKYHDAEDHSKKDEQIKLITAHFNRYFEIKQHWKSRSKIFLQKSLTLTYLTTKVLYLLNAATQFLLTDLLLSNGKLGLYGISLLTNFVFGTPTDLGFFPRQTLCDFYVREIGMEMTGIRYTVQCVLSINLFLQAMFSFYWFWLVIVVFYNCSNTFHWMSQLLSNKNSEYYVLKHIRPELQSDSNEHGNFETRDSLISKFIKQYLQTDGIFVLRLISMNVGDFVLSDLTSALYENFKIIESAYDFQGS
ncbi:innexin-11-like [Octopus sinensis]|uniref:Innexin n=1 Tax=Octopus sinensis TaxID=2607531 RepID=A0A6P7TSB2_9MOLL|nr:innexin-11-like [Octopus sinensis]